MLPWSRFPFLRITACLILGILINAHFAIVPTGWTIALLTIVFLTLFSIYPFIRNKASLTIGAIALLLIVLIGAIRFSVYNQNDTVAAEKHFRKTEKYSAVVKSYPQNKTKYYIYQIETIHALQDTSLTAIHQKIQLYIEKGEHTTPPLQYGDLIEVTGKPFRINGPSNPHEFDYAHYMSLQKIYFQQFCQSQEIEIMNSQCANPLLTATYRIRTYFEALIEKAVPRQEEQGIALALLLGIKDRLDPETKASYASVGAMHVLAVSGLHVGVIYYLLALFFKPIKTAVVREVVLPILSIVILWLYALLTGFSPSILRAVTMFSIIILAKALNRQSSIYNSIALSAFILLFINPNQLFAVGFQLSYLAVIGIVYIFDIIYPLWSPNSWLGDKIWTITSVSIAAQIATAPISIYYFHQFPSYFLVSNLFVIPAAFVIMGEGIFLLLADSIYATPWPGLLLSYTIRLVNWLIECVQMIPGSLLDWLYLSEAQTLLLYLSIVLFFAFLEFKKLKWFVAVFLCLITFSSLDIRNLYLQNKKHELVFYHTRDNQAIDHIQGLKAQLYTLDSIQDRSLMEYQLHPNRLASHLPPLQNPITIKNQDSLSNMGLHPMVIQKKRLLFISEESKDLQFNDRLKCDYLVIQNNAVKKLERLRSKYEYDSMVFSQSNSFYQILDWENQAKTLQLPFVSMKESYFTLKIE
ncbi:ComEC/Rec2 family competence protein [Reichenbachiella ulvae]|uniref:Competence protein ComEC family protein n=1 Tax=Reichenbachiella ulvae TaxID=2980104 RepID=A0ABT3CT04_9BACT|nr:ComEC/Rec2 family competence protein [Reichenbachiella ulvae]MCV9386716.1 competence protein ComEC family protein [Reichenbachiella ulvae]